MPSGLISVIPQACTSSMPRRSNASIIDGGTADPPQTSRRRVEHCRPAEERYASKASHTVGTPRLTVTPSGLE